MTRDTTRRDRPWRFGTVLIADDVPGLRALYRGLLEQCSGLEVVDAVGDGRSAIEAAHEHQPDLVLLDLSMPEMDGLEALPRIKDVSPGSEVVVLSGFLEDRLGDEARARGAVGYLEKTGEPDRFLPRLAEALEDEGRIRGADVTGAEDEAGPGTGVDVEADVPASREAVA